MEKLIEPKVLKGFRDFLPAEQIERKRIQRLLEETFESSGFVPIDTPALEYTEVLLGKGGGETDKQVYRFTDHGGRDVAMRFDLTVPFARFMAANRPQLYLPFKRYHITRVWRGENTQRGRYREFVQCDFDIVGSDSPSSDFEILLLMRDSFRAMDVEKVTIHFSHRGIFNRFLDRMGIRDRSADVLRTVDKITKIGEARVLEALTGITTPGNAANIIAYITPGEDFESTIEKMESLAGGPAEDSGRLRSLWAYMGELGIREGYLLDPSITRGLDYYTGLVFETFLNELPAIGSVCSGGRYNDLANLYTKEQLPGVGASIGLDRLMAALDELGQKPSKQSHTEILVFCLDESFIGAYHRIADRFRSAGFSCEVYPESRKLGNQFAFAEKKSVRLGLFCGEEEIGSNTVGLKDLVSRENHDRLTIEAAVLKAKEILGR